MDRAREGAGGTAGRGAGDGPGSGPGKAPDNGPVLAIVSPSFNQVSETFVADHVRSLAPGRTVLVCQSGLGAEAFGCPVLSHVDADAAAAGAGAAAWRLAEVARRLRRRGGRGPWLARSDRARLAAFLREQGVGAVLGEFGYSGAMVMETCAALGLPLHVYFRGHDATRHLVNPAFLQLYRRLFAQAASVICVSRFLAERLREIGCPERLIHVAPTEVDTRAFPPSRRERGRVLAVGRLVEMKAPHLTIRAFAPVAARFPEAHLDLVGYGPLEGLCREAVAELGLEARVSLHGAQDHGAVRAMMARAALFVQHSVTTGDGFVEGFPTAIGEAMASSVPVVSTRHSGIPEQVADGVSGLLVEEGDVAGMAEAMARLLDDPEAAAAMGRAGRAHAEARLDQRVVRARVREIIGLPEPQPAPGPAVALAPPAASPAVAAVRAVS